MLPPSQPTNANNDGNAHGTSKGGRRWSDKDWIFDTGATTHVCTDASLMHGYTSFAHSRLAKSVGYMGPNPISIKGIGDVSLDLPASVSSPGHDSLMDTALRRELSVSDALGTERGFATKGRLTIHNVSHIPGAGINIISWSQLRRAKGLELRLRDNEDGSLVIVSVGGRDGREGKTVMRFVARDGLYFLDRGDGDGR